MIPDHLIDQIFERLIQGDHEGTRRLLGDARRRGAAGESLGADALHPLLRMVRSLREAEQLTGLAHDAALRVIDEMMRSYHSSPASDVPAASESTADAHAQSASPSTSTESSRLTGENPFVTFALIDDAMQVRFAGPTVREREAPIIHREITAQLDELEQGVGTTTARVRRVALDLSEVRVMSSMAVGMCADVEARARRQGLTVDIVGLDLATARLLQQLRPPAPPAPPVLPFLAGFGSLPLAKQRLRGFAPGRLLRRRAA